MLKRVSHSNRIESTGQHLNHPKGKAHEHRRFRCIPTPTRRDGQRSRCLSHLRNPLTTAATSWEDRARKLLREDERCRVLLEQEHKITLLKTCLFQMQEAAKDLAAQLQGKTGEAEALRKDAERYRWLRLADWWSSPICAVKDPKSQAKPGTDCPTRDRLDAAIDAAMAAKGG